MFQHIVHAGLIVQLVLGLMALISVWSWAVILMKWRELGRAREDSDAFLEIYHAGSLERAHEAARDLDASSLATIFLAGFEELSRLAKYTGKPVARALDEKQLEVLAREISWTAQREELRLERGLNFLATTGSATPFIGLFGTVVGIINAFEAIGMTGSASLATVAPAIAEALIATGMGLFCAIPATIFYNFFVGRLRALTTAIELFTAEFEGDLRRLSGLSPAEAPVRRAGS